MKGKSLVTAAASLFVLSSVCWAADGAALYKKKCSGCHGANGEGKSTIKAPALKGTTLDAQARLPALLPQYASVSNLCSKRAYPPDASQPVRER